MKERDTYTVYRSLGDKRYVDREVEMYRKRKEIEMRGSAQLPFVGGGEIYTHGERNFKDANI